MLRIIRLTVPRIWYWSLDDSHKLAVMASQVTHAYIPSRASTCIHRFLQSRHVEYQMHNGKSLATFQNIVNSMDYASNCKNLKPLLYHFIIFFLNILYIVSIITASGSCIPYWCLTEVKYNRFISGLWKWASYIQDILLLLMYALNETINVTFRCIALDLHYLYYRGWHIRFGALIRLYIKTIKP